MDRRNAVTLHLAGAHHQHDVRIEYRGTISYEVGAVHAEGSIAYIEPDPLLDIEDGPSIYCATCKRTIAAEEIGLIGDWTEENFV
jgi:hypothetical protein